MSPILGCCCCVPKCPLLKVTSPLPTSSKCCMGRLCPCLQVCGILKAKPFRPSLTSLQETKRPLRYGMSGHACTIFWDSPGVSSLSSIYLLFPRVYVYVYMCGGLYTCGVYRHVHMCASLHVHVCASCMCMCVHACMYAWKSSKLTPCFCSVAPSSVR